jgi:hypothetical protein
MTESPYLKFSVHYKLFEYLDFVTENAFATEETLSTLTGLKKRFLGVCIKVIASTMFLYKSFRVGTCHFHIDKSSISRRSKGGSGEVSWSKVKAVHKYSPGYLIELKSGGAMPIPVRVLSNQQVSILHLLADKLMVDGTT